METLNKYYKICQSVYKTELTVNQYFEAFKQVEEGETAIKEELKTKTVKQLNGILSQLGRWTDSRDKKENLINNVFECLTDYFLLNRSVSYFLGEDTHATAKAKLIQGTTPEILTAFYTERRQKQETLNKSLENPQTLEEFRIFIDKKGKDALTPEQLELFEKLTADLILKRQKEQKETAAKVEKVNLENVTLEIYETKHSKTGADIFTVLISDRIGKDEFTELRTKAKKLGGYYSRYSDKYANPPIKPGFNFETIEAAQKFANITKEDQNANEEKEQHAEEVKQTAAEKMKERATAIIEKATEELNRPRLTNTNKRASQASSSEDKARAEITFAKKLIKIAEGLENGSIIYLHAIRNGKQLEQLESILNMGFYYRKQSLNLSYTEGQKLQKNGFEDVNFIKYPFPTYGLDVLKSLFKKHEDTPGIKRDFKNVIEAAEKSKNSNDLVIFKNPVYIDKLKKIALSIRDQWEQNRILEPIKDFERVQKMGLINEAILKTALRELTALSTGTGITEEQKRAIELKELERTFISKKIPGFFPTPEPLINRMFSLCKVYEKETILEPSAGLGHIAEAIKNKFPENVLDVVEYNSSLADVLIKKGFNTSNDDFLNVSKKYDVIFMNPPFENHQDIDHVKHAFNLLNPGGRIVAIMAGNKNENSSNKKILEFLEMVEDFGHIQQNEQGSFKNAFNSTNVNTVTVYLEKPTAGTEEEETSQPEEVQHPQEEEKIQCVNKGQQLTFFNF